MTNKNVKDLAFEDYCAGMKYKDIAEKYDINLSTIKSWASRYWKKLQPNAKKVATKEVKKSQPRKLKNVQTKRNNNVLDGFRLELKNTETKQPRQEKINLGGAPIKNTNAVKHGLFAKYLPAETLELVGTIETMSPLDILWENICLKYAAIIRSQKIMFVKDANDVTKRMTMDGTEATSYQYTEAYEKQASFLIAQSRAMGTLMSLIKQYDELCRSELATEEQKLRIEKLKKEINNGADDKITIEQKNNIDINLSGMDKGELLNLTHEVFKNGK